MKKTAQPAIEEKSTTAVPELYPSAPLTDGSQDERIRQHGLRIERLAAVNRVTAAIVQRFSDPLQAITNVLGGIHRRGCLEEEDLLLIDLAFTEVKKLNALTGELQEFYRPTIGKLDMFNVQVELEKIIEAHRQKIIDKGISITTDFADDIPLIQASTVQLNRVFQELLKNALDACDKDDTIGISTFSDQGTVNVHIEDSGCGIDPALLSQLFEPFSKSRFNKSAGDLELAVSYAIIILHGGTLDVEVKANDKVTTFKVMLPIKQAERLQHR